MPPSLRDRLRFPAERVLLARTRLAYVHLGNLLSDAKRDRAARVYGYVAIWLPDELLVLYLQEGEVCNAVATADGVTWRVLPIAEALARVPSAAEYGEICFHTAPDEQLAAMFQAQTTPSQPLPSEVHAADPRALLGHLMGTLFDGVVEVSLGGRQSLVIVRDGAPVRGFFAEAGPGDPATRLTELLLGAMPGAAGVTAGGGTVGGAGAATLGGITPGASTNTAWYAPRVRLYPVPPPLPNQAPPALVVAYRELAAAAVRRLRELGVADAAERAERARQQLVPEFPLLERFSLQHPNPRDPVAAPAELSAGVGRWLGALLATDGLGADPAGLVRDLTRDRRHLFQSAGLYDALPWPMRW